MNWQEIIDDVYTYWQDNNVNYKKVLKYVNHKFGNIGELAILFENYNHQVENCGHRQYFENGYCDGNGGYLAKHDYDIPLHLRMIELFECFNLHQTEIGKPVYDVMKQFNVEYQEEYEDECEAMCEECNGTGYLDDNEEEMCDFCYGTGYITEEEYFESEDIMDESLDDKYYTVSKDFVAYFEDFIIKNS